ncbi:MAG: hypothetical protein ABH919_03350 [bacterium]
MERRTSTEEVIRMGRSKIKAIRAEKEDTADQTDLRRICKILAAYKQEARLKESFVSTLNVNGYDVSIEPEVGILETPWSIRTEYLLQSKITFQIYIWNGREQKKMSANLRQVSKFLRTYGLWDEFCSQAMDFLRGKEICAKEQQPLLT